MSLTETEWRGCSLGFVWGNQPSTPSRVISRYFILSRCLFLALENRLEFRSALCPIACNWGWHWYWRQALGAGRSEIYHWRSGSSKSVSATDTQIWKAISKCADDRTLPTNMTRKTLLISASKTETLLAMRCWLTFATSALWSGRLLGCQFKAQLGHLLQKQAKQ